VQAVLADEVGAHASQVAFIRACKSLEEQARNGEAQHRIAQEFESLVVIRTEAPVPEGTLEQSFFGEAVAQAGLQSGETRVHR